MYEKRYEMKASTDFKTLLPTPSMRKKLTLNPLERRIFSQFQPIS